MFSKLVKHDNQMHGDEGDYGDFYGDGDGDGDGDGVSDDDWNGKLHNRLSAFFHQTALPSTSLLMDHTAVGQLFYDDDGGDEVDDDDDDNLMMDSTAVSQLLNQFPVIIMIIWWQLNFRSDQIKLYQIRKPYQLSERNTWERTGKKYWSPLSFKHKRKMHDKLTSKKNPFQQGLNKYH